MHKTSHQLTIKNGSIFFNNDELRRLVTQKLERQHKRVCNKTNESVFKNMDLLMHDDDTMPEVYSSQVQFMEELKYAIRGDCT